MISRSFGPPSYDTSSGRARSQSLLEIGSNGLSPTLLPNGNNGLSPFSSLGAATRLSAAVAATSGLPLNLLVDAAIGKVTMGGTSTSNSSSSSSSSNNISHQPFIFSGMKRGGEQSCTTSSSLAAQLKNLKRSASTSLPLKKKPRVEETVRDNSVLLQRLSTMSGGFPMPKWGAFLKGGNSSKASLTQEAIKISKELDIPPTSIGAFPLPRAKEADKLRLLTEKPVLTSFQQVWDKAQRSGDLELQKEVLARKLQKGTF